MSPLTYKTSNSLLLLVFRLISLQLDISKLG